MTRRARCAAIAAAVALAGSAMAASAQAGTNGVALFRQRCLACHAVAPGKASALGPNLNGVVNRKAASAPVPFRYSAALSKSGLAWTRPNLNRYLAGPTRTVPGTRMAVAVSDPKHRAALIDYLAVAK